MRCQRATSLLSVFDSGGADHRHRPVIQGQQATNGEWCALTTNPDAPLNIVIIDDDTVIRDGLPLLLPEFRFSGIFADVATFLAARPAAQVVLLELTAIRAGSSGSPPAADAASAIAALTRARYQVCLYTTERRRHVLLQCLRAGARGVVHKAEPITALGTTIRRVASGEVVVTSALIGLPELVERQEPLPTLSDRQRQVLAGRARGESYNSIATRLGVTRRTAEEHMAIVSSKFADYLRTHSPADLERLLGLDDDSAVGDVGRS